MRGSQGTAGDWSPRNALRKVSRSRKATAVLGAALMSLSLGACTREVTHESSDQVIHSSNYDNPTPLEYQQNGGSFQIVSASAEGIPAYNPTEPDSDPKVAKAGYNPPSGSRPRAFGRGTFNVDAADHTLAYAGAAYYFPAGTFTGSTPKLDDDPSTPEFEYKRADLMMWDNEKVYGGSSDWGAIRVENGRAKLMRGQAGNVNVSQIGSSFRLQEGCWNWIYVRMRLSDDVSDPDPTKRPINQVFLNGDKVVDSGAANNFSRIASQVHFGLTEVHEPEQVPFSYYMDNATVSNDTQVQPHTENMCEPGSGARPYHQFENQDLNDRMSVGVNVATGNLLVTANDVNIAGTGLDLGLTRFYNSQIERQSALGPRWGLDPSSAVRLIFRYTTAPVGDVVFRGPSGYSMVFKKNGSSYTSPPGLNATLKYDSGAAFQWTLRFNREGTVLHFDANGTLRKIADQNGNDIIYNFTDGRISSITDTQDRNVSFTYDGEGRLTKLTDSTGREWKYGYSGENLTSYTDPENKVTTYDYDGDQLDEIVDPRGAVTDITYVPGHPTKVASIERYEHQDDPTPFKTSFDYQGADATACPVTGSKKTIVTDPIGNETTSNPNDRKTTYCHEPPGRVVRVIDAEDRIQKSTYSSNSEVQTYTAAGNTSTTANATNSYDSNNSLTSIEVPTSDTGTPKMTTTFSYGPDEGGEEWDFRKFYPKTAKTPQRDPGGSNDLTTYKYDTKGNVKAISDPVGSIILERDAKGNITKAGYSPATAQTTPFPGSPPAATATTYEYDSKGNLTKVMPPSQVGQTVIVPDPLSRESTVTDGKGQLRTYTYDKLDRVTRIAFAGTGSPRVDFAYDANGNVTQRSETTGTTTTTTIYTIDKFNRVTEESFGFPSPRDNDYTYDSVGNLKTLEDDSAANQVYTYSYDQTNRLLSLVEPGTADCVAPVLDNCTLFEYDTAGRRNKTRYPGQIVMNESYDFAGRLEFIEAKNAAGTNLKRYAYSYVPIASCAGSHAGQTELFHSVTDKDNAVTRYCYDPRDRLTSAVTTASGGATTASFSYAYDIRNNRTSQVANGTTTTYTINNANQLTSDSAGNNYTYDLNGNQLTKTGGLALTYNSKDQTTQIKPDTASPAIDLTYRGANQIERAKAGNAEFVNNLLGLGLISTDGSLANTASIMRDDEGRLVGREPNTGDEHYYLFDGLGSVVGLTNSSGTLARSYSYDPYGKTTKQDHVASPPDDRFRFAGGYQGEADLYHFGMRYYDSDAGRWTQQDPIVQLGDLGEANRYSYVGGNPVNFLDPLGLHGCDDPVCLRREQDRREKPWSKSIFCRIVFSIVYEFVKKRSSPELGDESPCDVGRRRFDPTRG